jgi:hypothetical protein
MDFESNIKLAEGTLPGLIISLMYRENCPVSINFILSNVYPKFSELKKVNGTKYSVFTYNSGRY